MGYKELNADLIKNNVDIVDIVSRYIHIQKKGRNFFGLCPFHSERTPSLSVNPERQIFRCFGCGKGGDVFTFIMEMEGIPFVEAMKKVLEYNEGKLAHSSPTRGTDSKVSKLEDKELDRISRELQRVLELTLEHKRILQAPDRGMSDKELAVRGYRSFPEKPWEPLSKINRESFEGFPGAYYRTIERNGRTKTFWTLNSYKSGGILIPIHNEFNYIVGWQIRLDEVPLVASYKTTYKNRFYAHVNQESAELQVTWDGEIIARFPVSMFTDEKGQPTKLTKEIAIKQNDRKIVLGEVGLKKGQKYLWLSSGDKDKGTEAGNPLPVHVAVPCHVREKAKPGQLIQVKRCWVTEGPIKADKSSEITGEIFVGLPGLSSWRYLLKTIINMGVEYVVLAFDMDIARKDELREQIKLFKEKLFSLDQIKRCDIALWSEQQHGKGIDDMLLRGHYPVIRNLFVKQ